MQLVAEKFSCGRFGGDEWIDKVPTVQMCAEECKKKVGFIYLIDYARTDAIYDGTCNDVGCDCRCNSGCERTATNGYDLYEVAESKLKSVLPTSLTQ